MDKIAFGYATSNMNKYVANLKIVGKNVMSYNTHVATIDIENNTLTQHGYWAQTTQKHINYVARELGLTIVKSY